MSILACFSVSLHILCKASFTFSVSSGYLVGPTSVSCWVNMSEKITHVNMKSVTVSWVKYLMVMDHVGEGSSVVPLHQLE